MAAGDDGPDPQEITSQLAALQLEHPIGENDGDAGSSAEEEPVELTQNGCPEIAVGSGKKKKKKKKKLPKKKARPLVLVMEGCVDVKQKAVDGTIPSDEARSKAPETPQEAAFWAHELRKNRLTHTLPAFGLLQERARPRYSPSQNLHDPVKLSAKIADHLVV
jgi:hypothetical protein